MFNRIRQANSQKIGTQSAPSLPPRQLGSQAPPRPGIRAELQTKLAGVGPIYCLAFSPDGEFLASAGSADGAVRIRPMASGASPKCLMGHATAVISLAYSLDGGCLASGSLDGWVRLWDTATGYPRTGRNSFYNAGAVDNIVFSSDCLFFATGCGDQKVRVWNIAMGTIIYNTSTQPGGAPLWGIAKCLGFTSDGTFINTRVDNKSIMFTRTTAEYVFNAILTKGFKHYISKPAEIHQGRINSVAFNQVDGSIATASADGTVQTWDTSDELRKLGMFAGHQGSVRSVAFSPDGRYLASGSDDCHVILWDVSYGPSNRVDLREHSSVVFAVVFSPDGRYIASGSEDQTICVWRLGDFNPPPPYTQGIRSETTPAHHPPAALSAKSGVANPRPLPTNMTVDELWSIIHQQTSRMLGHSPDSRTMEFRDWTGYLEKGRFVGQGGFGEVVMGEWSNLPISSSTVPPAVVVKTIDPAVYRGAREGKMAKQFQREVEICLRLRHENVVPFIGITYGFSTIPEAPSLVYLWMENGSLRSFIDQNPQLSRAHMLRDVSKGVDYLHNNDIVHGDLKAENVLVDNRGVLRIGDFGLSQMISDRTLWVTTATSARGTLRWMAPELLDPDSTERFTTKASDIYAFAITAVEIITAQIPFPSCNDGTVVIAVCTRQERPSRPANVKDWLWELINKCWTQNPSDRLSSAEVVNGLDNYLF